MQLDIIRAEATTIFKLQEALLMITRITFFLYFNFIKYFLFSSCVINSLISVIDTVIFFNENNIISFNSVSSVCNKTKRS